MLFRQDNYSRVNIEGVLQYNTEDGFARLMRIEPSTSEFYLPQFVAGTMNPDGIADYMKDPTNLKHILAFGVPISLSDAQAQHYMEQVVSMMGFVNISKVMQDNFLMSFFSGQAETPTGDFLEILVVPQVKGNIMEIYAR